MGFSSRHSGQHEVTNTQQGQASDGRRSCIDAQDEEKNLDNVVVTLEVVQHWVTSEDCENDL